MTKLILSLIVLVGAALVNASALLPRASGTSSCYTCPPQDEAEFPLGSNSDSGGVLFCSYPAFAGENPNDFYCDYNDQTGALTTDNDAGFCPATAVASNCAPSRRDDNFTAMKRRRAALPQSSGQQARSPLRKKRAD
jgi:hypothetical protein